jgi:hypothetical protein
MEEAAENGKESSNSAHANGMNECKWVKIILPIYENFSMKLTSAECTVENS